MAKINERPTIDVQAGAAALDADLPRVLDILGARSVDDIGWQRPNKLALLIPMSAASGEPVDTYLLRMGFQAYRCWPPSAQFVNPSTLAFDPAADKIHIPKLTSPECHTHCAYPHPSGNPVQLVCCSATFEFYDVLHSCEPHHVWRDTDTFLKTLMAIKRAFASHYQGRFSADGT